MRPPTAHGVVLEGGVVVRKEAIGPHWNDATKAWDAPVLPVGVTPVTKDRYFAVDLGWTKQGGTWAPPVEAAPSRPAERFTRLEARLRAKSADLTALTATVATGDAAAVLLASRVDALAGVVDALTEALAMQDQAVSALTARVAALEMP
jgi:hypothetical protein